MVVLFNDNGILKKGEEMDYKAKRRKLFKTEEVKQYDKIDPYAMTNRLREIGYRSAEEYREEVSQYAW